MAMEQGGSGAETAAQRNARLQAAFNKASTSTKTTAKTYVAASAYKAPAVPKSTVPPPLSQEALTRQRQTAQDLGLNTYGAPTTGATPGEQAAAQGGRTPTTITPYSDPAQQSTWQRAADYTFTKQGSTKTYEDQLIADSARLTGQAIFNYGKIPNVISTAVANQLPYTYYGYSSADQFLKDLGYYEQSPGQWIQGEAGAGTTTGGGSSGTSSYRYATSGGGYTGRYTGSYYGLMNWRIGF